jgi:hypothetical protein
MTIQDPGWNMATEGEPGYRMRLHLEVFGCGIAQQAVWYIKRN